MKLVFLSLVEDIQAEDVLIQPAVGPLRLDSTYIQTNGLLSEGERE